jgi:hypothetical protein
MPLPPGDKPEPYEILPPIGAGGVGEAYKAATRIGRIIIAQASAATMTIEEAMSSW